MIRKLMGGLLAIALLVTLALPSVAQQRPTSNPTYIPTGILAPQTLTTAVGSASYVVQGENTVMARITGTNASLVAKFQGTNDPISTSDANATWTNLVAHGSTIAPATAPVQTITGNGLWRVKSGGYTRVRLNITSIGSGNVVLTMTGVPGDWDPLPGVIDLGALQTFTAQTAVATTTVDQFNTWEKGISCTFNQSAHTGTPSTVFTVQQKDTASGQYTTVLTSTAVTTSDNSPSTVTMFPAAPVTSTTSANGQLLANWRVSTVIGGSSPVVTGTLGCVLLP